MRILYLFVGLLHMLPLLVSGQTINLQQISAESAVCTGSALTVSFTTSGTFAAGNTFRVQLSANYGSSYIDLPGSFTSSPATVTIPAPSQPGSGYVVRVVADKPLIVSGYSYSFRVVSPPVAQITGSTAKGVPVNPYTTVNLTMALTGGTSYTLVLQDSTSFVAYSDYSSNSEFPVYPARTTTYSLASVRNACGTGVVSGSATVPINAVGFQLLGRGNESACLGTALPVYFSTSGPLPANTTFEAELISQNEGNRSIALPVSGTASPLMVTLPREYPGTYNYGYQLRIFSKSGSLSAYYRDGSTFTLNSSPRLALSGETGTLPFGGQTSLSLSFTSSAAGDVLLSDGRQITIYNGGSYGGSTLTSVAPTATTSYSIVSYSGVCSEGVTYGNRSATIQVRPGLRIDSLSAAEVCVGQPVTIYYTASPGYVVPNQLTVRLNYGFSIAATVVKAGQITFTPPASTSPLAGQLLQLRDSRADTLLAQARQPITIKTAPTFSFLRPNQTVPSAGEQYLDVSYYGGGVIQVVLNTGTRLTLRGGYYQGYYNQTSIPLYVSGTTTFSTVSITNECGTSQYATGTTVLVQNAVVPPTGVVIKTADWTQGNPCPGSTQWVNVFPTGTFNADNRFQFEVTGPNGNFTGSPVQSFSAAIPVSFQLANQTGTYRVRVSSTSPVTRSNELTYTLFGMPTASVSVYLPNSSGSTSQTLTTAPGQVVMAQYNFSDGRSPFQYELANGSKGRSDYSFQTTYQPTVTTSYGLVRVTDACGQSMTITSGPAVVEVVPSILKTGALTVSQVCVQSPVLVPYTQLGTVPTSASYVVQCSEDLTTWQTVPTSGSASPLTVTIPASLANKQVYYRVSYLVNSSLVAGVRFESRILIKTAPDVVLTTPSGATAIQIDRNSSSSAEMRLLDVSSDASVILTNGTTVIKTTIYASGNSYYATQPGTYSIASAYNSCGYGRATGLVKVTEKPYLSLIRASRTSACVGQTVSFTYVVAGDYNAGNKLAFYLVDNYASSSARSLLAETTALSGVYTFTLSPSLRPSSYSIQIQTSAPATILNGFMFSVDAPVSATLTSGANVTYEGDTQYLSINTQSSGSFSAVLSTPTGLSLINVPYNSYSFSPLATQSGSYSIVSVTNQCGAGTTTGVLSVTVIPRSAVTIRPAQYVSAFCTNQKYAIQFSTTGVFSTTNTFTAYLIDSTGVSRILPTQSSPSQLTITLPADVPPGERYMLRVGSSSPQHLGSSTPYKLAIRQSPTGTLTGNTSIFKGDSTRISVALTGIPPWQFVLSDFFGPRTFITSASPYTLTVKPDTTVGFRLVEVRDSQCGIGTAAGTALITVTKLLATEPALPLQVRTWPNPTTGWLQLEGDVPGRGDVMVSLYNAAGTLVQSSVGLVREGQLQHRVDLSSQPAGVYILTAEQEGRRSQFKVLKQ